MNIPGPSTLLMFVREISDLWKVVVAFIKI